MPPALSRPGRVSREKGRKGSIFAARTAAKVVIWLFVGLLGAGTAVAGQPVQGLARYGAPKYPAGFDHFDYVNPDAPKGGELRLFQVGGFDTLNPFGDQGTPPLARGASVFPIDLMALSFDTLLAASADEPASAYGLIAESVELSPDHRWVIFNLRSEARFHDGTPVTADDVIFSFDTLKENGTVALRTVLRKVNRAEKISDRKVRFVFADSSPVDLPLALGRLPILSKAYCRDRSFARLTLEPPLGSGPYRVEAFDANRSVVLERVEDYWANNLPVTRGLYNFAHIRTTFYADQMQALAAFKTGDYDVRLEFESRKWATAYRFPAVARNAVRLSTIASHRPEPMRGFVFNLRRDIWRDDRVRQALIETFDFESINKTLLFSQYSRVESYFANSDMAAEGPPNEEERRLLEPLRGHLDARAFTDPFSLPVNDTPAKRQATLRETLDKLGEAGWTIKGGRLLNAKGEQLSFEILLDDRSWQPFCRPFAATLAKLGIRVSLQVVDPATYRDRLATYDFDMTTTHWPRVDVPGEELREFWGSTAADRTGGHNLAGVKEPALDQLIDLLLASPDRATLLTRTHALDRALLWGHYVIPQWYMAGDHLAVWDKFGQPDKVPDSGAQLLSWWRDPAKAEAPPPAARRHRHP